MSQDIFRTQFHGMRRVGKNDILFLSILSALLLVFLVVFILLTTGETGSMVEITVDGELFGTYSLEKEQTIDITNQKGTVTNVLQISKGQASMREADCPDHLCVKQKAISKNNENIVCLPNKIVVTVKNNTTSDIDVIVK